MIIFEMMRYFIIGIAAIGIIGAIISIIILISEIKHTKKED